MLTGAVAIGGFALNQRSAAQRQANQADARGLAAQAVALASSQSDTALLLAAEGYRRDPSIDTESGLLAALNGARFLTRYHRELPADITAMALSHNAKTLVVLTSAGVVQRYETDTWRPAGPPVARGIKSPAGIYLSADDRFLLLSADGNGQVIDLSSGKLVGGKIPTLGDGVFRQNNRTLLGSDYFGERYLVADVATSKVVSRFRRGVGITVGSALPTKDEFVLFGSDGTTAIGQRFNIKGNRLSSVVKIPDFAGIDGVETSPDGKRIVVFDSSSVELLDQGLKRVGPAFKLRGSRVSAVSFSPDGKYVAVAADDGSIQVAYTSDGHLLATLSGLSGQISAIFLDGHRLLASTPAATVEFDLEHTTAIGVATRREDGAFMVSADPSGKTALVAFGHSVVDLDAQLVERSKLTLPKGFSVDALTQSAGGDRIAVHGYPAPEPGAPPPVTPRGQVLIYNKSQGTIIARLTVKGDAGGPQPTGLGYSDDGQQLAIGTYAGLLSIYDESARRLVVDGLKTDVAAVLALHWSPTGDVLYEGGQDGVLRAINPRTGHIDRELPLSPGSSLGEIVPVPRSNLFAISSEVGSVFLVDPTTFNQVGVLTSAG
ncbi:MAG TPA: WD40 repeat domain-containing protein, partial [Propionibacteriaceae bacterium]